MPIWSPPGGSAGVGSTTVTSSITNIVTGSVSSSLVETTNNYVTGFATASLLISAASLSGGMQLVAATGTLPQRLTMDAGNYITSSVSFAGTGFVVDPDNLHFWSPRFTAPTELRRFRISDGVIDYSITGSTTDADRNKHLTASLYTLTTSPGTNNRMWSAVNSTRGFIAMIDPNNSPISCEVFQVVGGSVALTHCGHVIEHVPGKVLVKVTDANGVGTFAEYAYNGTGSTNTCTYTGITFAGAVSDAVMDASGSVYMLSATQLKKMVPATLTASATVTAINATYLSAPGYGNVWRTLSYHPQANKIYVGNGGLSTYDVTDAFAVDLTTFAVEERVFGPVEFGNPMNMGSQSSVARPHIGYASDGSFMVYVTHDRNPTNMTTQTNARTLRLNPQRARWTWTPTANAVVTNISFAGMMNNDKGFLPYPAGNAWFQSERDKRWTKFYYSLDGGVSRYEFQNASVLSLNVSTTSSLTIDCEMQVKFNNMNGTFPYLGTSLGRAATIIYRAV